MIEEETLMDKTIMNKFMDHAKACNGFLTPGIDFPSEEEWQRAIDARWEEMRNNKQNEEIMRSVDEDINKILDKIIEQKELDLSGLKLSQPEDGWYFVSSFVLSCKPHIIDKICADATKKAFPFMLKHYPKIGLFDKFCIQYVLRMNRHVRRSELFDGEYFKITYRLPFCKEKELVLNID